MANRRLFLAEQSLHEIRMRIWATKTIPKAENIKGTATTKTSPGRRMSVAGLAGGGKRREQIQSQAPPPQGGQYGQQGGQQGGQGKGKGKKGEASPTPSPR